MPDHERGSCFECGASAVLDHHVIPVTRGGTKTVPLCNECHSLVHGLGGRHDQHVRLTQEALDAKKVRGEALGGTPLGYRRVGKQFVPDPEQRRTVDRIVALRKQGMSLSAIMTTMTAEGWPTKRGGKWWKSSLQRILVRECPELVARAGDADDD